MNLRPAVPLVLSLWLGTFARCDSVRSDPPPAQPSSDQVATSIVRGKAAQAFTASCLIVEPGTTIEFRNLTPGSALSIVSTKAPYELSSPALRDPYNLVPPEKSDECALRSADSCVVPVPFSFWRHTFNVTGIFDYHDTSGGTVQATAAYGMPAGTTTSAAAASGTICVRTLGSTDCNHVCCTGTLPDECALGVTCVSGRCGGISQ